MASGIDDDQHTPTATAAHTARYDLQADMVATQSGRRPGGGHHGGRVCSMATQSGRQRIRVLFSTDGVDHGGRVCSIQS